MNEWMNPAGWKCSCGKWLVQNLSSSSKLRPSVFCERWSSRHTAKVALKAVVHRAGAPNASRLRRVEDIRPHSFSPNKFSTLVTSTMILSTKCLANDLRSSSLSFKGPCMHGSAPAAVDHKTQFSCANQWAARSVLASINRLFCIKP